MAMRRLIKANQHQVMPWKNGQGMTAEIAIDPPDTPLSQSFRWRLSLAEVKADGPFSAFPGYDRTIMLMGGNGMVLRFDKGREERIDEPHVPFQFSGDDDVRCWLIDGSVRDFNLMVRRDLQVSAGILTLSRRDRMLPALGRGTTLILYVIEGDTVIDDGTLLEPGDTLIINVELAAKHAVAFQRSQSKLFMARLTPKRQT
jgi:environmental stress-induced protein Ves